jgi:hypothetical protein
MVFSEGVKVVLHTTDCDTNSELIRHTMRV